MRNFLIGLIAILAGMGCLGTEAGAQPSAKPAKVQKMSDGAAASAPATPSVKMIWDFKSELGLSDEQISNIKTVAEDLEKQTIRLRANLQVVELDVQDLVQKKADLAAIKTKLEESASLQVQLRLGEIEAGRRYASILSPAQIEKWKKIQERESRLLMRQRGMRNP